MNDSSLMNLIYQFKSGCVNSELEIMMQFGLSPAEYNGIASLDPGEEVCGTTVSEKMNLSPSRSSRVVEKMVQKGYLIREIDSKDRRKCTISLSPRGMDIKNQIDRHHETCEKRLRDALTEDEIKSFSVTLNKIIDKL
jgi:MarR family transcriptional regulator, organic hydroperoxide resistance regulator